MRILSRSRGTFGALLSSRVLSSLVFSSLVVSSPAGARAEADIGYTREQTFSAALRYLRVDLAYEVTEKDADAAYLLFSFSDPELQKKSGHGSIEVVQREHTVRLLVSLPELPSYREDVLKRGLLEKLHTEYGEPPAPGGGDQPKKPPPKADDPPQDPPAKP